MLLSMTGYGKSRAVTSKGEFLIEAKSYNNRFLDVSIKLPKYLQPREFEIREICKEYLCRGKIYINIESIAEQKTNSLFEFELNKALLINEKLQELRKKLNIKSKIKLRDLLFFSSHFIIEDSELNEEDYEKIKNGVREALIDLNNMRASEGEALKKDLNNRINFIYEKTKEIENINSNLAKEYFEKIKEKAYKLSEEITQINNERLEFELALLAEKIDITEEIVRLKNHLNFFQETLNGLQEAGKRLNFIAQEINREINTIASKTVSFEISKNVVIVKEEIEKIREQLQNIE